MLPRRLEALAREELLPSVAADTEGERPEDEPRRGMAGDGGEAPEADRGMLNRLAVLRGGDGEEGLSVLIAWRWVVLYFCCTGLRAGSPSFLLQQLPRGG